MMMSSGYDHRLEMFSQRTRFRSGHELVPYSINAERVIIRAVRDACERLFDRSISIDCGDVRYFAKEKDSIRGVRFMIPGLTVHPHEDKWFLDISQGFFRQKQ